MIHNKLQDRGKLLCKRFNHPIRWQNFVREFVVWQKRVFPNMYLSSFAVKVGLVPLFNYLMDKFQGVDTYGYILQSEISSHTKIKYGPGGWWDLKMTLGSKVSVDDVFADFGSGKGRMVYLAARYYPFKKVIGVEIFDNLNNIARKNIERNLHRLRCKDVQLETANVSNYSIPENVTVVYFYDPFRGAVFIDLINRLRISLNQHPREMRIIYRNPRMHDCIIENGFTVTLKLNELTMYTGH